MKCEYCGNKFIENKRGNCDSCGAPNVEKSHSRYFPAGHKASIKLKSKGEIK